MKSIEFSDQELDFLRQQYLLELEEAENYVKSIKAVLVKQYRHRVVNIDRQGVVNLVGISNRQNCRES